MAGYKINIQNSVLFLHINNKHIKIKIKTTIPFIITSPPRWYLMCWDIKSKESTETKAGMTKVKEGTRALMWWHEFKVFQELETVQYSWSKMSKMWEWTEGSLERDVSHGTLKRHSEASSPWEMTEGKWNNLISLQIEWSLWTLCKDGFGKEQEWRQEKQVKITEVNNPGKR